MGASRVELLMNDNPALQPVRPEIEEFFHRAEDGVRLFACSHPLPNPDGVVLLTHGLGEHSGRYGHVVHSLLEKNLAVVRFDLRGHGRSDGLRGHTDSYSMLMDDVSLMARETKLLYPEVPMVVVGHSLGGNVIVNWVMRRPEEADMAVGAVLSSPWFLLSERPPWWKVSAIRRMASLWPTFPIPAKFRGKKLTSNEVALQQYEHDPLVHHQITVRMAIDCHDAADWAMEHAERTEFPILATHGTADAITDPEGTVRFCQKAPNAELILFDDLVHEPHNEPEWRRVVNQISDWISVRVQAVRSNG